MARHLHLQPHLSVAESERRYRSAHDPNERSWWQILWLLSQRSVARVQHRYAWRYLVGFVHPASGRTLFHLATTASIPVFEVELAEFARQASAGPHKQIVLILDRAGWHTSVRLHVA